MKSILKVSEYFGKYLGKAEVTWKDSMTLDRGAGRY